MHGDSIRFHFGEVDTLPFQMPLCRQSPSMAGCRCPRVAHVRLRLDVCPFIPSCHARGLSLSRRHAVSADGHQPVLLSKRSDKPGQQALVSSEQASSCQGGARRAAADLGVLFISTSCTSAELSHPSLNMR